VPIPFRLALRFVALVVGGMLATVLAPHYVQAQSSGLAWTRAIATRALVRGDTLRADDFLLRDTLVSRLPFGADTTTPRIGWLVQRPIAAGEWLRAPGVIARPAVTAGRPVHAIWSDGTVRLAVAAIALNSAPVGGAVAVRVGRTRRLDGIAVAPDSVRLR
jgi:flagella basal body P-ring formation protein FlgA